MDCHSYLRQNLGLDRAAIEDYDNALRLLPRNRQLLFNKALAQTDIEDYSGARETFDELLRYYPSFSARLNRAVRFSGSRVRA